MRNPAFVTLLTLAGAVCAGESATPPPGPPWKRELAPALEAALEGGKPIFLYFTKTY